MLSSSSSASRSAPELFPSVAQAYRALGEADNASQGVAPPGPPLPDIHTIDQSPANLYTFAQEPKPKQTKKYKPVAKKVKPVLMTLPANFRIQ